jgi:general secretion pathway protein K
LRHPRPRERGIALILVLWVFMLLGVLALDFAQYIRDDAMAAVNFADETRGYYVALAGMNRALYEIGQAKAAGPAGTVNGVNAQQQQLQQQQQQQQAKVGLDDQPERQIPSDGEWHDGDFAGARWSVRISDEGARIAINALRTNSPEDEAFLHYIVQNLVRSGNKTTGVDRRMQKTVDTVVDSILDWRDRDTDMTRPNGAENAYYHKQRIPYDAKNGEFESPEELLKVRGVTPRLFYGHDGLPGLRDVFSFRPAREDEDQQGRAVNLRHASDAVLYALVGDADSLENLLASRDEGTPMIDQVRALMTANAAGQVDPQNYLAEYDEPVVATIEARADMASKRNQSRIAALVDMRGGEARVLRWYDKAPFDGAVPGLPATAEDDS